MHALRFCAQVCRYGRNTTSTGEKAIEKAWGHEVACTKMIGKAETTCAICTVYAATEEQRKSVSSSPTVLISLHVEVFRFLTWHIVHIRRGLVRS